MAATHRAHPRIARRIARLGTETAFAVSGDAASWAAQGHRVYPFHLGDMNIRTPLNIIRAAYTAMVEGRTFYTPAAGIPQLREALAEALSDQRGVEYDATNVSVQPGGKPCIGKFLMAVMEPGDGVLYPNPGYPIYESQVDFLGGRGQPYTYTVEDGRFRIDHDSIQRGVDDTTRVLIVNAQHNPTGADASEAELEWLAELARERDLWVLSDDPYIDIRYAGSSHSIVEHEGMCERTVIGYTFSKKYAMTGWRLGYAAGPAELIKALETIQSQSTSNPSSISQAAAVAALTGTQEPVGVMAAEFAKRRNYIVDRLRAIPGITCTLPEGAFYVFPNVSGYFGAKGQDTRIESATDFALYLLEEARVALVAGEGFGAPNNVRISYATSMANLEQGMDQMEAALKRLGG
jgi:aspartate/methionine/tyrosine aminotransferase